MFNQTEADLQPYMTSGSNALSVLNQLMGINPQAANLIAGGGTPSTSGTAPPGSIEQLISSSNGFNIGAVGPPGQAGTEYQIPQTAAGKAYLDQLAAGVPFQPGNAAGVTLIGPANFAIQGSGATPTAPGAPIAPTTGPGTGTNGAFNPNAPLVAPFLAPAPNVATFAPQFQSDPGYQFAFNQGLTAVNNSAAAQGGRLGGNTLQALTQYGQGVANQEFFNQLNAATNEYQLAQGDAGTLFNMLQTLAGSGQNAAAHLGAIGATTGATVGGNIAAAGNAQAAGIVGSANATAGGINSATSSISNAFQTQALLQALQNQNQGGGLSAAQLGTLSATSPGDI
jgi:hypothetical protein